MELMRTYNTDKAIVFNTYQCYLKKAHKTITLDLEQVLHHNSSIKHFHINVDKYRREKLVVAGKASELLLWGKVGARGLHGAGSLLQIYFLFSHTVHKNIVL